MATLSNNALRVDSYMRAVYDDAGTSFVDMVGHGSKTGDASTHRKVLFILDREFYFKVTVHFMKWRVR
jgi:hypothetical protein